MDSIFKKKNDVKKENGSDEFEMVLLKTIGDNYELNVIKGLLDEHKIPYIIKDRGIGGYMRIISGKFLYQTDILVGKLLFEKAQTILDEFPWDD